MSSLISGPGCFFVVILGFMILGFQRGWKREVISLVFVLLATFIVNDKTSDAISAFLGRVPAGFAFLSGTPAPEGAAPVGFIGGTWWSLIIFGGLVVLGYFVGDRVFKGKPDNPKDRFIGMIPGLLSGAFVLWYVSRYFQATVQTATGGENANFNLAEADPARYVPAIFVIAILALVVALISDRVKKAQGKK